MIEKTQSLLFEAKIILTDDLVKMYNKGNYRLIFHTSTENNLNEKLLSIMYHVFYVQNAKISVLRL
jgi:hypothetical protein